MILASGVQKATKPNNRRGRLFSGQSLRLSSLTNPKNWILNDSMSINRFDKPQQLKNDDPF